MKAYLIISYGPLAVSFYWQYVARSFHTTKRLPVYGRGLKASYNRCFENLIAEIFSPEQSAS